MDSIVYGSYELVSWKNTDRDGLEVYPFGENAGGYITYTAQGFVSVHLMSDKRSQFERDGIFDGKDEEIRANYNSFISYFGTYTVNKNTVSHHLLSCSFPNWENTTQIRNWVVNLDKAVKKWHNCST